MVKRDSLIILTHKKAGELNAPPPTLNLNNEAGIQMWHESDEDAPPTISGGTFEISMGIAGGAFCL